MVSKGLGSHRKAKTIGRGSSNEKPPFLLLPNQTCLPYDIRCIWNACVNAVQWTVALLVTSVPQEVSVQRILTNKQKALVLAITDTDTE